MNTNEQLLLSLEYKRNMYSHFPKYKKLKLNKFLSRFKSSDISFDYLQYGIDYFNIHNENYMNIIDYKKDKVGNFTYKIIKDTISNTWFFTCKNILILYINKKDYEEFILLNQESPFCYYVYKTDLPYYILICTSHTISEIKKYLDQHDKDIISFYNDNLVLIKYIILSEYLNSLIILNKKQHIYNNNDQIVQSFNTTRTFTLYNKIGCGYTNTNILQLIQVIKTIYNIFKYYPKHYLEL